MDLHAEFLLSVACFKDMPKPHGNEFCILGRSNVGKSSFINHVFNDSRLARVSKTPGKTTLANFYRIDATTTWVDLPGYGFARASGNEKQRWSHLIRDYCENRTVLKGVLWLLDVRHPGTAADQMAYDWLLSLNRPVLTILTKCDKLKRKELSGNVAEYARIFPAFDKMVLYSIEQHHLRGEFVKMYEKWNSEVLKK